MVEYAIIMAFIILGSVPALVTFNQNVARISAQQYQGYRAMIGGQPVWQGNARAQGANSQYCNNTIVVRCPG